MYEPLLWFEPPKVLVGEAVSRSDARVSTLPRATLKFTRHRPSKTMAGDRPGFSRGAAAREAGISRHRQIQALRVATAHRAQSDGLEMSLPPSAGWQMNMTETEQCVRRPIRPSRKSFIEALSPDCSAPMPGRGLASVPAKQLLGDIWPNSPHAARHVPVGNMPSAPANTFGPRLPTSLALADAARDTRQPFRWTRFWSRPGLPRLRLSGSVRRQGVHRPRHRAPQAVNRLPDSRRDGVHPLA